MSDLDLGPKDSDCVHEWGPFITEREWGTPREDLTFDGRSWEATTYESASVKDYISGEDGLFGVCHSSGLLCFAPSFWNGHDKLVKQRLFGLSGPEGNHSEDVKEYYAYGLCSPTYRYFDAHLRLPQSEFPYRKLREVNARRSLNELEYKLEDTGIFNDSRFFDIHVEYAALSGNTAIRSGLLACITVRNCAAESAIVTLAPRVWLSKDGRKDGTIQLSDSNEIKAFHPTLGHYTFTFGNATSEKNAPVAPLLVTASSSKSSSWKAVIDEFMKHPQRFAKEKARKDYGPVCGCAAIYKLHCDPHSEVRIPVSWQHIDSELASESMLSVADGVSYDDFLTQRRRETLLYYDSLLGKRLNERERNLCRASYSLALWNHQLYSYSPEHIARELRQILRQKKKDKKHFSLLCVASKASKHLEMPANLRNQEWSDFAANAILGIPDRWEFPWFALWDWCFQLRTIADVDPHFAAAQLRIVLSNTVMRADGALPGCEYGLSDQNPPLVAWAALHVCRCLRAGVALPTLVDSYLALRRNFDWWMSQKCVRNLEYLFSAGFLGLDNVSILNRSALHETLPPDCTYVQADATAWMCLFSLNMFEIAGILERAEVLSGDQRAEFGIQKGYYRQTFENIRRQLRAHLLDASDLFFYDTLFLTDAEQAKQTSGSFRIQLRIRSAVGLIPFLCTAIDAESNQLLSVLTIEETEQFIDRYLANEREFLGKFGIRSFSRFHAEPNSVKICVESVGNGSPEVQRPVPAFANALVDKFEALIAEFRYAPAESDSRMFGGNSNWRGPVWICINYLIIESLQRLIKSNRLKSDRVQLLESVISRLASLFDQSKSKRTFEFSNSENLSELQLFHEFYDPDTGRGCGASFQSWTTLIGCAIRMLRDEEYAEAHSRFLNS